MNSSGISPRGLLSLAGIFFALIACVPEAAWSEDGTVESPVATLDAMRTALRERTYRGIVAYTKENQVENMEVIHAVINGVEREKVVSLNGPMREVVRVGKTVQCFLPGSKSIITESQHGDLSSFVDLPEDFSLLTDLYDFDVGRRDRVAQREAIEINVVPRDDERYARRIWVDLASKLPLRVELLGDGGAVLEQMVFSSLQFPEAISPNDLEPSSTSPDQGVQRSENHSLPIDSLHWTLQGVPSGFRIVSFTRMSDTPQDRPIDHLLLSDGLASISIYFDHVGDKLVVSQPSSSGAINAYSRKIDDVVVTAMGEAPAKTVQAIANGLRRRN